MISQPDMTFYPMFTTTHTLHQLLYALLYTWNKFISFSTNVV